MLTKSFGAVSSRQISIASHTNYKTGEGWKPDPELTTIGALFEFLRNHKIGSKSGLAITQGTFKNHHRTAKNIIGNDIACIDIDNGTDPIVAMEWIKAKNLTALIYSSHSHKKTVTTIATKKLGDTDPIDHLINIDGYLPAILEGATRSVADDVVTVRHKPMPKFRVVFPLKDTIDVASMSIDGWKARYRRIPHEMGISHDTTCEDPAKLFFCPRHDEGIKYLVWENEGELLDFNALDPLNLRFRTENKKKQVSDNKVKYLSDTVPWLRPLLIEHAEVFDADSFFEAYAENYHGKGPGEGECLCPHWEDHTDVDETARKLFVKNGDVSQTDSFVVGCNTQGCSANYDRIHFVEHFAIENDLTENDMRQYVGLELLPTLEDIDAEIKTLDDESKNENIRRVLMKLLLASVDSLDSDDFIEKISKKTEKKSSILRKVLADLRDSAEADAKDTDNEKGRKKYEEQNADIQEFNEIVAYSTHGSKDCVIDLRRKAGEPFAFYQIDPFKRKYAPTKAWKKNALGQWVKSPLPLVWMEHELRKSFEQIVFEPGLDNPKHYNLFQGFPVEGIEGDWSLLRSHVFEILCGRDEERFDWLMSWMAQIIQQPRQKLGSAVIVLGKKGTGKTKLFDWFSELFGCHALTVSQRQQIVGNFNSHQAGLLFMQAEETFWAGDKQAEGALKILLPHPKWQWSRKGTTS